MDTIAMIAAVMAKELTHSLIHSLLDIPLLQLPPLQESLCSCLTKCHGEVALNGCSAVWAQRIWALQHTLGAGLAGDTMRAWGQHLALRSFHADDTQIFIVFNR